MLNRPDSPRVGNLSIAQGGPQNLTVADLLNIRAAQRLWWVLRHKKPVAIGAARTSYFDATTPNPADGNVLRANSLPAPMMFQGVGITVRIPSGEPAADLRDVLPKGFLTLEINQRVDFGPISIEHLPAGGGVFGNSTTAATDLCSNGLPTPQAAHFFPIPYIITANEQFTVTIDWSPVTTVATEVEVGLWGILHRKPVSQ